MMQQNPETERIMAYVKKCWRLGPIRHLSADSSRNLIIAQTSVIVIGPDRI